MNYFNVGKIVNTQGLQGEMRVLSVTDFTEERFKKRGQNLPYLMKKINLCEQWLLLAIVSTKTSISSSSRICTISMPSKNSRALASRLRKKT